MKAKKSELTLGSTLCSLLLFFYFAYADEKNCCSFPTDDCSDMFRGTGITLECHQSVEFPRQNGGCLPVGTEHQESTDGQIELVDFEIMYKVKCPSQYINEDSYCERSSDLNYIGLNITFRITEGSVEGVQFNLQTVAGEVKPIVGTLKKSCHNLNFSGVLTADMAGDRLFSYTNYVGLHPNSQYNLTARTFNNANSDQLSVSIPNCRQMINCEASECDNFGKWSDDFFCSIPSPASFTPDMWVYQNLSSKFTIWDGNPQFSSYVVTLKCNSRTVCGFGEELQTETVPIRSGQETLHNQFSVNLQAGFYEVEIYGQPDAICEADQHWGSSLCPSAKCSLELKEDVNHCENPLFCQSDHSQCVVKSTDDDKEVASCECSEGFEINETSGLCEDINECETASNLCGHGGYGYCTNTEGSAHCICLKGYKPSREGLKCEDINECETESNLCGHGGYGYCNNTKGSAHCICLKGYKSSREGLKCEEQISVWVITSVAISITVAVAAVISFTVFVVKKCCHCGDENLTDDFKTVTSNSELAQFTPVSLILEPPPHPRGPLESIQGGSEEPLMDTFLRSI
ncbi:Latent-transforming growth factor beta-binding protein 1 [Holothuria leucospilota]|uniref:Latent-transforming growth factor beta-binding protein 1 n=1 Tax=Holothuria leucospilota TaxID=206669 RepID=A0A9Q1CKP4_HOLLE|nr:Latent-transforming growth factor beta-binding protein 1 [Holothuria leucospilota]